MLITGPFDGNQEEKACTHVAFSVRFRVWNMTKLLTAQDGIAIQYIGVAVQGDNVRYCTHCTKEGSLHHTRTAGSRVIAVRLMCREVDCPKSYARHYRQPTSAAQTRKISSFKDIDLPVPLNYSNRSTAHAGKTCISLLAFSAEGPGSDRCGRASAECI